MRRRVYLSVSIAVVLGGVAALFLSTCRPPSPKPPPVAAILPPTADRAVDQLKMEFTHDLRKLGVRKKTASSNLARYRAKRIRAILDRDPHALMDLSRELEAAGRFAAARDVLMDAARLNDAAAKIRLGVYAALGLGGPKDLARAEQWLEDASQAASGDTYAQLARLYLDGKAFPPDRTKAERYVNLGVAAGSGEALFLKAAMLLDQGDTAHALDFLAQSAQRENPDAMRLVARLYANGDVVSQNADLARALLHEAADKGSTGAQVDSARLLLADIARGQGQNSAVQDAVALLFDAKDKNSGIAALELAKLTLQTPAVTAPDVAAAHQFAEAAYSNGVPEAAFAAAATLVDGNDADSLQWLKKGAAANDWRSEYALRLMHSSGLSQADAIKTAAKATFEEYLTDSVHDATAEIGFTPPSVITAPMPKIPDGLRVVSIQGQVTAELSIDSQGKVQQVGIVSASHPELEEAVRIAMLQWQFKPAYRNGVAVPYRLQVPVRFQSSK